MGMCEFSCSVDPLVHQQPLGRFENSQEDDDGELKANRVEKEKGLTRSR